MEACKSQLVTNNKSSIELRLQKIPRRTIQVKRRQKSHRGKSDLNAAFGNVFTVQSSAMVLAVESKCSG